MPNPHWLNFVITSKARTNIRNLLKEQQHSQSVDLGNRLLDKASCGLRHSINTH
jgi:guanosine-3',5'-bis(diphosphate) 3'-pyrophosphohydrolase